MKNKKGAKGQQKIEQVKKSMAATAARGQGYAQLRKTARLPRVFFMDLTVLASIIWMQVVEPPISYVECAGYAHSALQHVLYRITNV